VASCAQITGTKADLVARLRDVIRASPPSLPDTPASASATGDSDDVEGMRVADLKVRLKSLGAKTSGTKPELQTRLRAHLFLADDEEDAAAPRASDQERHEPKEVGSGRPWASASGTRGADWHGSGRPAEAAHVEHGQAVAVRMSGGAQGVRVTVDKTQKRKGVDELGLTARDREKLLQKRVVSLYRRCMRSAERCPDDKWRLAMLQYVRGRFRDTSTDAIPIRISMGEVELEQMNGYHAARERAAREKEQKQRRLAGTNVADRWDRSSE
jgi:hypothetical protein